MKTKDFIKMLQEADPSGESHVRIDGGAVFFAEPKEGYWDGPYNYIEMVDGKPKWTASTKGYKVDIRTMDLYDFVEWYDGDLEEVKKNITIEYDYVSKDRENDLMKKLKEFCDEYNETMTEINKTENK